MAAFTQQVRSSGWPLVVVVPSAFGNKVSLDALTTGLEALLERGERFCILCDLGHKSCMELHEVQHLELFFRTHGRDLDAMVAAMVFAAPSAMVRGALRVVLRARSPGHPCAVLRGRRDSLQYLRPYLDELSVPAAVGH